MVFTLSSVLKKSCWIILILLQAVSYSQNNYFSAIDLDQISEDEAMYMDSILSVHPEEFDIKEKAIYYNALVNAHEEQGNYYLAINNLDSLISIYESNGDDENLASAYRDKSLFYDYIGQYPSSLNASLKSLDLYKKLGNKDGIAMCYNDIGVLHYYDNNVEKATEYYNKALAIYQEIHDTAGIAIYYNNMANLLYEDEDLEKALDMYEKAYQYDVIIKDEAGQTIALSNIGETYLLLEEYNKAEKYFLDALTIAEDIDDPWSLTNPLTGLGQLYQETGELHKAIRVLEKSVAICNQIDAISEQNQNFEILSNLYKSIGDYKKSLYYHELFKTYSDSLITLDKSRSMKELEMKYHVEEKAHQIEALEQEKLIQDLEYQQEIEDEKSKQLYLIIILGSIAIILMVTIRGFIQKKKVNQQLKQQNFTIQQKNAELNQAYHQIEEKNSEILDSINYAKRIQLAILPPRKSIQDHLPDSFILYKPKDVVAGDFYWLEKKGNKTLFAAADCTGHGVPGAMVSVVCNNGLNRAVREHNLTDPGKILDKAREIVNKEFGKSEEKVNDGMDIALCCLEGYELKYSGAHNPLWIYRSHEKTVQEIKADKQPIVKFHQSKQFTTHTVKLNKGDIIYLFSDGYADQFGGDKGKKLKTVNFKKLLESIAGRTMNEQLARLDDAFEEWKGEMEQLDDVCVIGVRVS